MKLTLPPGTTWLVLAAFWIARARAVIVSLAAMLRLTLPLGALAQLVVAVAVLV